MLQPVLHYLGSLWGQHTLGMELDAMDIVDLVSESHDMSVVGESRDKKTVGEMLLADHPTVITPHHQAPGQTAEDVVVVHLCALGGHSMIDFREVLKLCPEHFAYGLVTQTDSKDGLLPRISLDNIQEQASLGRDARTGAEVPAWGTRTGRCGRP